MQPIEGTQRCINRVIKVVNLILVETELQTESIEVNDHFFCSLLLVLGHLLSTLRQSHARQIVCHDVRSKQTKPMNCSSILSLLEVHLLRQIQYLEAC